MTLSWLLRKQVNINDKNKEHATALMLAAEAGHVKIGRLLFKGDANLDATNVSGCTALMLSLKAEKADFSDWLVEACANILM